MHLRGSGWRVGITLLGVAALVAGCAGSETQAADASRTSAAMSQARLNAQPAPPPTVQPKARVLATAISAAPSSSNDPDTKGLTVQINSAQRDASGLLTLTWTLSNHSGTSFDMYTNLNESPSGYFGNNVSSVQLVDNSKKLRFYSVMDNKTYCVCSANDSGNASLSDGSEQQLYNIFKVNPDTKTVDVTIRGFKPAKNVPVT